MIKFHKRKISEYLESLASCCPVPGGGSAAALAGAMGAALILKAIAFTTDGKNKLAPYARRLKKCFFVLREAIYRDGAAYMEVARARKMPRNTPRLIAKRNKSLSRALLTSAAISHKVILSSKEALGILDKIKSLLNKNFISDIFCARRLLETSVLSSQKFFDENINANLRLTKKSK